VSYGMLFLIMFVGMEKIFVNGLKQMTKEDFGATENEWSDFLIDMHLMMKEKPTADVKKVEIPNSCEGKAVSFKISIPEK